MKKIFNLFVAVSLLFIYSCDDNADFPTDDYLTGTATEGGAIVAVHTDTEGKILGIPSSQDFETATVSIAEVGLDMEVLLMSGGLDVQQYEIVKTINGGAEFTVTSGTSLPLNVSYATTSDFTDGLGITPEDLRIGDVISFRTKIIRADGSEVYANEGTYNVTVSCSSDLAGIYDVEFHYTRASTSTDTYITYQDEITVTGVGEYRTGLVGAWSAAQLAPGTPGFTLVDLCGEITVPLQNLADYWANMVEGTGSVDGDTGVISVYYTVCFDGDCRVFEGTFTPVD